MNLIARELQLDVLWREAKHLSPFLFDIHRSSRGVKLDYNRPGELGTELAHLRLGVVAHCNTIQHLALKNSVVRLDAT